MPSQQKQYSHPPEDAFDLPTTTFGPLDKYVAANDNLPAELSAGEYLTREQFEAEGGFRYRLNPSTDSGQFNGDNPHMEKTPEERLPGALDILADMPGYIYLGSPYSKYKAGYDAASRVVSSAAASLMRRGLVVYSPIAHGHTVAAHGLPLSWDFWKRQCQPMIDAAASLVVLTMDGWQESVGLQYEIDEFVRAGKPILHVSPAWLFEDEMGRAVA